MQNLRRRDMHPYMEKVHAGLLKAISSVRQTQPNLASILSHAHLYKKVKGLDMDVVIMKFPAMANGKLPSVRLYLWDWIDARNIDEIASYIIDQTNQRIAEGDLPPSSTDFLPWPGE